ncbi:antitoxin VapB family protein [Candidatus Woesearchaeota archaeon]|nr:antitoxin VapB family protein [Candidatus Woesearchaeota archaeon]
MATKTITIMDDAYELLSRAKLPNESFSDTVRRIAKPAPSLLDVWGAWDEEFAQGVRKHLEKSREQSRRRSERIRKMFA